MTIFNLGSINIDHSYRLPHLVAPGETLAALEMQSGLGGKGANMSVAAARAGSKVVHIGAIGADGGWTVERLKTYGVETSCIATVKDRTGHAIVMVDQDAENAIVLYPGANQQISDRLIQDALDQAQPGDTVLFQNETNQQSAFAKAAKAKGLRVAYAAAPFDAEATQAVLADLDFLILNQVEAEQLRAATGQTPEQLPVRDVVITLGAEGSLWFDNETGAQTRFSAPKVTAVDTTGAGDTFTGYVLSGMDRGLDLAEAIPLAAKAAALKVTRKGTADVIPTLQEVNAF